MDFKDIMQVLSEFSELREDFLVEEIVSCSREIDLMTEDIEARSQVLDTLLDELSEQKSMLEHAESKLETLDVELIRAKTEYKKLTKNIKKLKSLNVSGTTIELTENDRRTLATNRLRISLMKQLLRTSLFEDGKGIVLSSQPFKIRTFVLKDSHTKQQNRAVIWRAIGNSSGFNRQWRTLFQQ